MRAAREQPVFLKRFVARVKPVAALGLPFGKIPALGKPPGFAHALEHAIEFGAIGEPFGLHREDSLKWLVGEDEAPVGAELRDAGGEQIEHVALGARESPELSARLFEILDVERIACDPCLAERDIDDADAAPFTADGGRNNAAVCFPLLNDARRNRGGAGGAGEIDEFEPTRNCVGGVFGLDGGDIGLVDERQPQIGTAMPHRKRRRLDQRRERRKRLANALGAR